MNEFDNIRPYQDNEVSDVLARLSADRELLDTVGRLRLPRLQRVLPTLSRLLVQGMVKKELRGVSDVASFQRVVKRYIDKMMATTSTGFSVSGQEHLPPSRPCLFVSNHRDITLDPALMSYALYQNNQEPSRIAIGDNLLSKPWSSDLMRINKCFIVHRSVKGRAMLAATKTLSAYIRHSLEVDKEHVWIAQREGRAKDSLDKTEPAIIRMLGMSRRRQEAYGPFIESLCLVPLAISYEWDPCDVAKAKELFARANGETYRKGVHEDLTSIGRGIIGQKGAVHLHFGKPLDARISSVEEAVEAIDHAIWRGYCIHPTNAVAYHLLHGKVPAVSVGKDQNLFEPDAYQQTRQKLLARLDQIDADLRPFLLAIYANPVVSRLKLA